MRYNQDSNTSPLTLESSAQPSPVITLYPSGQAPVFNPTSAYQPEGAGTFYHPTSHIFSNLDVRPRLGSNSASSTGMAHAHRSTALPHPGAQLSTRDLYSTTTPSFRRPPDHHQPRSPSFPAALRRQPLSPTPSPSLAFTAPLRMDSSTFGSKAQQNIPPLQAMHNLGSLVYVDGSSSGTPIKLDIHGTIDKGFFLADSEWTCYRRNYFSCVCSYSLSPHYPNTPIQYTETGSTTSYQVFGFAMCISAVVAENDGHTIDLVQHTPKRDKGPTAKPEKVRLLPKPAQAPPHTLNMYGHNDHSLAGSSRYDQGGYGQAPPSSAYPTEHTFERIQFKQATANNGKRRAAQQYYHLVVELWADIQNQGSSQYIKIAYRKSAKMIVRGRSPGHYQSERRGSTSSGPGGSAGSMGYGSSQVMGSDFGSTGSATILPGAYGGGAFDPRPTSHYGAGTRHHHDLTIQGVMSPEEAKAITETKDYQYYPAPIYEGNEDPRQPVEMFSHHRNDQDTPMGGAGGGGGIDLTPKVKQEGEAGLPSMFFAAGPSFYANRCGRFEGKSSSAGYYPTMMPPPPGLNVS